MECVVCLELLCRNDSVTLISEDQSARSLKICEISHVRKNSSENILKQLKALDDCSINITQTEKRLIQEIQQLAKESLRKLQTKRVSLLSYLNMTSISAQVLSELEAISQEVLVKEPAISLRPVQDQLEEYFRATPLKHYKSLEEQKKFEE